MIAVNKTYNITTTADIIFDPDTLHVLGYEEIEPQGGMPMVRLHTVAVEHLPDGELTRTKWTDIPRDMFLLSYDRDKLTGEITHHDAAVNQLLSPHFMQLEP